MRKESDRGCVFVLDRRALDPRHRAFLRELPLKSAWEEETVPEAERLARLTLGDTERCVEEALAHMQLERAPRDFASCRLEPGSAPPAASG